MYKWIQKTTVGPWQRYTLYWVAFSLFCFCRNIKRIHMTVEGLVKTVCKISFIFQLQLVHYNQLLTHECFSNKNPISTITTSLAGVIFPYWLTFRFWSFKSPIPKLIFDLYWCWGVVGRVSRHHSISWENQTGRRLNKQHFTHCIF